MPKKKPKNKWIAGILNYFVWGVGYLYLEKKTNFAIILILSEIILFMYSYSIGTVPLYCDFVSYMAHPCSQVADYFGNLFLLWMILVNFAFGYDAYSMAEE